MRVLTRENAVVAGSVVLAIVAFVLLTSFTALSPWLVYAVVFAIGVVVPLVLTRADED
ncbi:MAG: hypothetical protein ABEJ23_10105 [Haloarculaceae archaeon]